MAKVNIFSDDWCNLVFESRPKDYGAYVMRTLSSKRHRFAILLTLVLFIFAFTLPGLIRSIRPASKNMNVDVNALSNIKLEIKPKNILPPKVEEVPVKIKSTIKFTPPVIKDDVDVKDDEMMKLILPIYNSKRKWWKKKWKSPMWLLN